jgi:hypothetical protein
MLRQRAASGRPAATTIRRDTRSHLSFGLTDFLGFSWSLRGEDLRWAVMCGISTLIARKTGGGNLP